MTKKYSLRWKNNKSEINWGIFGLSNADQFFSCDDSDAGNLNDDYFHYGSAKKEIVVAY